MTDTLVSDAPRTQTVQDAPPGSFPVTIIVRRFDPDVDDEPRWQDFDVMMLPTDRILDALHQIKWEQDGSLTFRRSCAHGVCGSDAMRINGRNRLACKTLIKDLDVSKPIYVEAIKGLPLEKDLVVDMEPFFASYREVQPFLQASSAPRRARSACSPSPTVPGSTTPPSASSALRARRRARCSGRTVSTSVRPRSSTRTASSSTRVTTQPTCVSTS